MKLNITYVSSIALDANFSLIKELNNLCDINFIFEIKTHLPNRLGINYSLGKDILIGSEIEELKMWASYIPLEKTYVVNSEGDWKKIIKFIQKQISVLRLIKNLKADIIHCGNELHPVFFLFLFLSKKNVVLTVHDPIHHSGEKSIKNKLIRLINFWAAKKFILLNSSQKSEFIKNYHLKEQDVFVSSLSCYNYLNNYVNSTNQRKGLNKDRLKILFFGRISPYKGVEYLLEAFYKFNKENTSLLVAGAGSYHFDIKKYLKQRNISIINRFLSTQELVDEIIECDIIICPYTDATQSGVIMSAFALNKPVIATNVGGLPEMIEDGITGMIIPAKDVNAIIKALDYIYNSPMELVRMSHNIEKQYQNGDKSWRHISQKLVEYYKEM